MQKKWANREGGGTEGEREGMASERATRKRTANRKWDDDR